MKEQEVLNRLKRIEGQIKGLQKMIEARKKCGDILTQVAAVKAAINKVGIVIFECHFKECLENNKEESSGLNDEHVEELLDLLGRYIK